MRSARVNAARRTLSASWITSTIKMATSLILQMCTNPGSLSEVWLGEWMASRKNRDEIVLATRYTSPFKLHEKGAIQANYGGTGIKSMRLSLEASLRNLQTSYIDLFYVHVWDFTTSIPGLMQGLNDLVVAGKVIYLGISDTPAWVVSKTNQYARDHGLRQFTVHQGM